MTETPLQLLTEMLTEEVTLEQATQFIHECTLTQEVTKRVSRVFQGNPLTLRRVEHKELGMATIITHPELDSRFEYVHLEDGIFNTHSNYMACLEAFNIINETPKTKKVKPLTLDEIEFMLPKKEATKND